MLRVLLHTETSLMYETMVVGAELDEVVQGSAATPRPMLDVVGMEEPVVRATREPAAAVTAPECSPQLRGDGSLSTPH